MIFDAFTKVFWFLFLNVLATVLTFLGVLSLVYGEFPPPVGSIYRQLGEMRKYAKGGLNLQFYKHAQESREGLLNLADGIDPKVRAAEESAAAMAEKGAAKVSSLVGREGSDDDKTRKLESEIKVHSMKIQSLDSRLNEIEATLQRIESAIPAKGKIIRK